MAGALNRSFLGILLAVLFGCADTAELPPLSLGSVPPQLAPGHWMVVPLWVRGQTLSEDVVTIEPRLRFEHLASGQAVDRRLQPLFVQSAPGTVYARPAFRLVKGPDQEGEYRVTVELRSGARVTSSAVLGDTRVSTLAVYGAWLLLPFGTLSVLLGLLCGRQGRVPRWALGLAAVVVAALSWRWLLGGHSVFLGVVAAVSFIAARAPTPATFLTRGSVCLVLFDEFYWGAMVNGARWTGVVYSVSALVLLTLLFGRLVRSPRALAATSFACAAFLTGLYVSVNIYKSFFLDVPAISVAGDAGQVGRLMDSVLMSVKITHVLALLAPLGLLLTWGWLRWRGAHPRILESSAVAP